MSDLSLLMTGILSPELSISNSPKVLPGHISAIQASKNSQLHQVNNETKVIPPEFSDLEKPWNPVNTRLSLTKEEAFKRLADKFNSKLPTIVAEYKQSPSNARDSFSTCTQTDENQVNARVNPQQQLPLCSGNSKLQIMKISATNNCTIENRVNNQILIAAASPNLTPSLKSNFTSSLDSTSLPTLRFGNSGISVKVLQRILLSNGYAVRVDGTFGALTETAVKAFQSQRDLAEDGVVGGNTWRELTS